MTGPPLTPRHVSVCICTFKRPELLLRTLEQVSRQETNREFTFSIVVTDNDERESARTAVEAFRQRSAVDVVFCVEPRQNIALARNRAVLNAKGDFIVFIDDDEFPTPDWLRQLIRAIDTYNAAGVLGPVRPHFEQPPPQWVVEGRFCERPEYPTGHVIQWHHARTGNVLFKRAIVEGSWPPFDPAFHNGGEDMDFFRRMTNEGHTFVWCNEAVVLESVPAARLTRSYMLRRALLRGKNILKHSGGRTRFLAISLLALPAYALAIPVVSILGQHVLMKYSISFCDHLGRILGLVGLNPVSSRDL